MVERSWKVLQFVKGSERYGASVSIRNLAGELKRRGHNVSLLVYRGRSLGPEVAEQGIPVLEMEPQKKFNIRGILRLRNLFMREAPDVVHTHLSDATLTGTLAARFAKIPVVSTVHGMNKPYTYVFANHLIAVSEAGRKNLMRQGISGKRVSVAYNGIPMPCIKDKPAMRDHVRAELGVPDDALLAGTISRADRSKGMQDAITAVAILQRVHPNLHYVIAGEGDYIEELRELARACGLRERVHFLGYRSDVVPLLASMDVFLFPSLREAMGISIVEAMAMQLPVVGTRVGGIPEVIDDASGILVDPEDSPAIAEAASRLLDDADFRLQMGLQARKRAEHKFSLEASAEAVERVYSRVVRTA